MDATCRSCDSMEILDQLVRTGIWSKPDSLLKFRRIVLDVDSIVLCLHQKCVANHLRRQMSINKEKKPDLYSATLVNYTEFARLVKQLLDYLQDHKIEPILVYGGKAMEAPLFGLLASEFTKNTQRVTECINIVNDYDRRGLEDYVVHDLKYGRHLGRSNLALIIFKSIVNVSRRTGNKIHVVQAFYSPYPQLAKLARDFRCPVITNNGDFIIMDVRAGFILFQEFWSHYVEQHNLTESKSRKPSSSSNIANSKSYIRSNHSTPGADQISFHFNNLFLHQHPGLNSALAMDLYPLTTVDFVTKYGDSLKRLKVYDTSYKERDFMPVNKFNAKLSYKRHHMAANRLEMVLGFLCSKTVGIMGNLIRGEATRTNTSFDDDFRNLFNFRAVAYEFKHRLRFALKYLHDPVQLNYIEWCLTNRECSADYLLDLLCCSIGRLACVSYNKNLQFEDLKTKHSAFWLKNHSKSMLMSLFTSNKSHKGEHSISLSNKQHRDTVTRYSTASLTIFDRHEATLNESNLTTTHENYQLDTIREKLQLTEIAHRKVAKQDRVKFINLTFTSTDITQMPAKLEALVGKILGKDEHSLRNELAIVRSLSIYSYTNASIDDKYFKDTYSSLIHQFEIAIVNHYLYLNEILSRQKQGHLSALVNLIHKLDYENVADDRLATLSSETGSEIQSSSNVKSPHVKSAKSLKGSSKIKRHNTPNTTKSSKHIRHLIELLGTSIETYCELNAFFDYPLPRLNISRHYNPILLYNLTLQAKNNALIKL